MSPEPSYPPFLHMQVQFLRHHRGLTEAAGSGSQIEKKSASDNSLPGNQDPNEKSAASDHEAGSKLRRLGNRGGFTLVEVLVAFTLITIGALALAATMVGTEALGTVAQARNQALSLATATVDKFKSLPYNSIYLAPDDPVFANPNITVPGATSTWTGSPQWQQECPFGNSPTQESECTPYSSTTNASGRMVVGPSDANYCINKSYNESASFVNAQSICNNSNDPRVGEFLYNVSPSFDAASYQYKTNDFLPEVTLSAGSTPYTDTNVSAYNNNLVVYTYIYYPYNAELNDGTGGVDTSHKLLTVVVRYEDNPRGNFSASFGTIRLTADLVNNPGGGTIVSNIIANQY